MEIPLPVDVPIVAPFFEHDSMHETTLRDGHSRLSQGHTLCPVPSRDTCDLRDLDEKLSTITRFSVMSSNNSEMPKKCLRKLSDPGLYVLHELAINAGPHPPCSTESVSDTFSLWTAWRLRTWLLSVPVPGISFGFFSLLDPFFVCGWQTRSFFSHPWKAAFFARLFSSFLGSGFFIRPFVRVLLILWSQFYCSFFFPLFFLSFASVPMENFLCVDFYTKMCSNAEKNLYFSRTRICDLDWLSDRLIDWLIKDYGTINAQYSLPIVGVTFLNLINWSKKYIWRKRWMSFIHLNRLQFCKRAILGTVLEWKSGKSYGQNAHWLENRQ